MSIENNKWRFPGNNYGPENGLDTSDMEMFKKDPDAALAREICQNSIDAQVDKHKSARVEFKTFELNRDQIPGIDNLYDQIVRCCDYKNDSEKEYKSLNLIKKAAEEEKITCLRISDFNTTGLLGVSTNEKNRHFYNLTKGSGLCDKGAASGGSKGIGKFASFVASSLNTVFYSTKTIEGETGYIGISKLRSAPIPDGGDEVTQGTGYFGCDDRNYPILEELTLDTNFKRDSNEYGTDVYIIGFNNKSEWVSDILAKILDSFMVAIKRNGFEVVVDDIVLNNETIKNVIFENEVFAKRRKEMKKPFKCILAQYDLLYSENSFVKTFSIYEPNDITVYVKSYTQKDDEKASKRCELVRYPYMKITHKTGYNYLPYSALCVIEDSKLSEKLRKIENPQHTDWEIKRLNDYPEEKKETRNLQKNMDLAIADFIKEVLSSNVGESTDVEGASDYLPSDYDGESGLGMEESGLKESVKISEITYPKIILPKTARVIKNNSSYDIDAGEISDSEDSAEKGYALKNGEHNSKSGNQGEREPNEVTDSMVKAGKNRIVKKTELGGMKVRNIIVNRYEGIYDIVFTSLYNEKNCEVLIKEFGESNDKYDVEILSAKVNGKECEIEDGRIVNLELSKNTKYKITYTTKNKKEYSSEVIIYACR